VIYPESEGNRLGISAIDVEIVEGVVDFSLTFSRQIEMVIEEPSHFDGVRFDSNGAVLGQDKTMVWTSRPSPAKEDGKGVSVL
jgi:hypothetical protein